MDNSHFFSWDNRRDIAHPGDLEKTILFCVEHFILCAKEAIKLHGHFFVALSGGTTPKEIFTLLATPSYANQIDWSKVILFWGDERNVLPDHIESNFHMAMEAGIKHLPILESNTFRMKAEKDIEKNALLYEKTIKEVLGMRPLDLIMLGMGKDGHTASLFPNTKALEEKTRFVVANYVPQKKTFRMTMTFPFINKAKNIIFYVMGKSKQIALKKVFHSPPSLDYPASLIGSKENKALWVLDTTAYNFLS